MLFFAGPKPAAYIIVVPPNHRQLVAQPCTLCIYPSLFACRRYNSVVCFVRAIARSGVFVTVIQCMAFECLKAGQEMIRHFFPGIRVAHHERIGGLGAACRTTVLEAPQLEDPVSTRSTIDRVRTKHFLLSKTLLADGAS